MKKLISSFFDKKFLKFVLVGVVNTLVGSAVMFLLYNLAGCGYWFSSVMNYVVGSVVSYFLNRRFTFGVRERSVKQVLRFILNIAVCYGIAYGLARPLVRLILQSAAQTVQDNAAMLVGMVVFVALNYLGQRFFAFREPEEKED